MIRCLSCGHEFDSPVKVYDKGEENRRELVSEADSNFSQADFEVATISFYGCPNCGSELFDTTTN